MFHIPHATPIAPHTMGVQIDVLPLTNYIWIILAYNSKESWDKCQCKLKVYIFGDTLATHFSDERIGNGNE